MSSHCARICIAFGLSGIGFKIRAIGMRYIVTWWPFWNGFWSGKSRKSLLRKRAIKNEATHFQLLSTRRRI